MYRLKKRFSALDVAAVKSVKRAVGISNGSAKKRNVAALKVKLAQFLSGPALQFVSAQLAMSLCQPKGRRWTAKMKGFALSLLHSSPKTYRML